MALLAVAVVCKTKCSRNKNQFLICWKKVKLGHANVCYNEQQNAELLIDVAAILADRKKKVFLQKFDCVEINFLTCSNFEGKVWRLETYLTQQKLRFQFVKHLQTHRSRQRTFWQTHFRHLAVVSWAGGRNSEKSLYESDLLDRQPSLVFMVLILQKKTTQCLMFHLAVYLSIQLQPFDK